MKTSGMKNEQQFIFVFYTNRSDKYKNITYFLSI